MQIILRKRLLEALRSPPALTLVRAPAGFGKSTLLAQWAAALAADYRICTLSLVDADNAVSRLQTRIQRLLVSGAAKKEADLQSGLSSPLRPIMLMIDDCDRLQTTELRNYLLSLGDEMPDLRLVLASRRVLGLPIARRRAMGAVLEIGPSDLRLDQDERQAMVHSSFGHGRSIAALQQLDRAIDGWACGFGLASAGSDAALSRGGTPPAFTGTAKIVAEYFTEEVMANLDAELASFLTEISVLGEISAPLCNALVRHKDSQILLDRAYDAGALLHALDPDHRKFCLHPLFGEFLLGRMDAGKAVLLRQRAVNLLEDAGEFQAACKLALELNDQERAGVLLDRQYKIGSGSEVEYDLLELATKIDPAIRDRHPYILLGMAQSNILRFRLDEAEDLVQSARQLIGAASSGIQHDGPALDELEILLSHREMMLALGQNDMPVAQRHCDRLLGNLADAAPKLRIMIFTSMIQAQLDYFNYREVERLYLLAQSHIDALGNWVVAVPLEAFYCRYLFLKGSGVQAIDRLERALRRLETEFGQRSLLGCIPGIILAEMKLEQGDWVGARLLLDDYREAADNFGFVSVMIAGRVSQARLLFEEGRDEEGMQALERPPIGAGELYERVNRALTVERISWLVRRGDEKAAFHAAKDIGLSLDDMPFPLKTVALREESAAVAWVRLARARDRLDEAAQVAGRWLRFAEGHRADHSSVRWSLLLAAIRVLQGESREAQRVLRKILPTATSGQFVRSFLGEALLLRDILKPLADLAIEPTQTRFIMDVLSRLDPQNIAASDTDESIVVTGSLTVKEIEILKLVARGLLNREIGNMIGMTEGTVKWYMQNAFTKLGVRRRSQAVLQARRLNFLD